MSFVLRMMCIMIPCLSFIPLMAPQRAFSAGDNGAQYKLVAEEEIAKAWPGCSVSFTFQVHNKGLYAAYYQADRSMVVARRPLDADGKWEYKVLPTQIKWDSHNYIAMTFDSDNILHVAGNMHGVPLIYFRAEKADDVATLRQVEQMTGDREKRVTYPVFMTDAFGNLLFCYRDGGSGNGDTWWNRYDVKTRKWSRLMDTPLFDGQNQMNAYPHGPVRGPDGYYHLIWVWRDTYKCETNHDLTYARTPDMIHWEDSYGRPITLPINLNGGERIAAVPAGGGLLNSHITLSFDSQGRVIVTWSQYDENGYYQIWNARREKDGWRKEQASHWQVVWNFTGGGCIPSEVKFGSVGVSHDLGCLVQSWNDIKAKKSGYWYLDPDTLKCIEKPKAKTTVKSSPQFTSADNKRVNRRLSDDPRMSARAVSVSSGDTLWIARWETLPVNRDRAPEGVVPDAAPLMIYRFERTK